MMERLEDGRFEAAIEAEGDREIDFCFKDGAGNWDNNDGHDWILPLL
ncbi:MAG: hypothetical protein ACM3ZC_11935 [Bacteroidota bacterium]